MIRRALRWAGTIIASAALAGCSDAGDEPATGADPLIFEIANADGEVEGWMLGTIHALPSGTRWRTPAIAQAVQDADYLIVEIADLEDRSAIAETFTRLATSPGHPPLPARADPRFAPQLAELMDKGDLQRTDFSRIETWGAALMLARVAAPADSGGGVDRAIIADFAGRDVHELEGAAVQLGVFDALPEADQRDLLNGVLEESRDLADDPDRLRKAWLAGDEAQLADIASSGMMADPELYSALLKDRNARWTETLVQELAGRPRPLIAVGTGHLVGPDSLGEMLERRGYTVRRITP